MLLYGHNKDAFTKAKFGAWEHDILGLWSRFDYQIGLSSLTMHREE